MGDFVGVFGVDVFLVCANHLGKYLKGFVVGILSVITLTK